MENIPEHAYDNCVALRNSGEALKFPKYEWLHNDVFINYNKIFEISELIIPFTI